MHRINRVEIELQVDDAELARELSDRVSRMHQARIAPAIDTACSELSSAAEAHQVERLELDLGVVSAERFEDELLEKLVAALRSALGSALRRHGPTPERSLRSALELVETFALCGALPWWADPSEPDVVARHVARAAREAESELVALVRRIGGDAEALDRLARASDPMALNAIARRAGVVAELAAGTDLPARRAALAALAGVAPAEHGSEAALSRPTGSAVGGVAALRAVRDAAERTGERGTNVTGEHVHVRLDDAELRGPDQAESRAGAQVADEPVTMTVASRDRAALAIAPDGDATATPAAERAVSSAVTEGEPIAHVASAHDAQPPSTAVTRPATPSPRHRLPMPEPAARARDARRAALAKLDEVYVDDAGLVILWPFLERLFSRIGLVDDKRRFVDDGSALEAVALLELMVFPDSLLPEFQLPLVKLLCGRPLESVVAIDEPPPEEHRAEADYLLASVIDQVKALGELSIDGFRTAFLQRRGALTTRDGAWLLQVERQPQDVLLERFSWSWTWVKLPWMADPLRVEW